MGTGREIFNAVRFNLASLLSLILGNRFYDFQMKTSIFFSLLCAALFALPVHAQKVKFKKQIMYVDGVECLRFKGNPTVFTYSNLEGEEVIFLKFLRHKGALYNEIVFVKEGISFTTQSYIYTKKLLAEKLLEHQVLQDCQLNREKVKLFAVKFDEPIGR